MEEKTKYFSYYVIKASVLSDISGILQNICDLPSDFTNDVALWKFKQVSNNIHEITEEINRLYKTNYQGILLRCMSINQIADEIVSKLKFQKGHTTSWKSQSAKGRRLNMVVVGRSGVGKSSFLNYAAGKQVFKTGMGDPVTQSYFDVIEVDKPEKNVIYSLFDTKGLEAGNTKEWEKAIYSEMEHRDKSDNIYDWFHTIIYCIDASSKRIQPFEIKAIKEMAEKGSVLVLLTKKDLVTPDILQDLRKQILMEVGDKVQVLSVCSVSTRTRKGESKASGLEDVLRVSFLGLWEKASKILPLKVIRDIVNINQILIVDKDLADLCAYASLTCCNVEDEENEKIFISGWDIAELVKKDYFSLIKIEKNIPFEFFKKIEEISDVNVKFVNGDIQITLENVYFWLFSLPKNLDHDLLDTWHYWSSIGTYIRLIQEIFSALINKMKNKVGDIKSSVGKNGLIVNEILNFYNDINKSNKKPLFYHKTEEAISELEQIDYDKMLNKIQTLGNEVRDSLKDIANTFFSSGYERREANRLYSEFRSCVTDIISFLESNVQKFISSYEAELHSYGQYCIREDEFARPRGTSDSFHNKKEEQISLIKKMIRLALSDGSITTKERMMLESIAEANDLSNSQLDQLIREVYKEKFGEII